MTARFRPILVLAVVTAGACGTTPAGRTPATNHASAPATPASATPSAAAEVPGQEVVIVIPGIGQMAWRCERAAGSSTFRWATTFTSDPHAAGEEVTYSLNGSRAVKGSVHSGRSISTPLTRATSHVWTLEQAIEPYLTHVTISLVFVGEATGECDNPVVSMFRARELNDAP